MSKVKYPDREKIRNQIDIILDKSDLFNDSQDKTIHTDNKIVELKPVREKIPVMRVIQFVATAAAIVIFVVAVKNYSVVNKKHQEQKARYLWLQEVQMVRMLYIQEKQAVLMQVMRLIPLRRLYMAI